MRHFHKFAFPASRQPGRQRLHEARAARRRCGPRLIASLRPGAFCNVLRDLKTSALAARAYTGVLLSGEGPCIAMFRGERAGLAVVSAIFGVGPRFLYGAALYFTPLNLVATGRGVVQQASRRFWRKVLLS